LPPHARIRTCDQSPFESVHVLATGDVVPCEVHDEAPVGNLGGQTLREIWQGDLYRTFRRKYGAGEIAECRECVWKVASLPVPWESMIDAAAGRSPQLLRGWYLGAPESVFWSKRECLLALRAPWQDRRIRIVGILPRAPGGNANTLRLFCNNLPIGCIINGSQSELSFDRTFPLNGGEAILNFQFLADYTFWPALWGVNSDQRDLGFALQRIEVLH
jgi:radical SAM protein with 4Fe4S-binding SPASM domain